MTEVSKSAHSLEHQILLSVLKQLRTECSLTQRQLAEKLGLPQSYVSKFETGERRLDLIELATICSALNMPLSHLISRFEEAIVESKR